MSKLDYKSDAVHNYLGILQDVINRMSSNSTNSKAWCIALVSAIIVILSDKPNSELIWIGTLPTILFLFLDSYYLGLEQRFRDLYNEVIFKIQSDKLKVKDIYIINPGIGIKINLGSTLRAMGSLSVWPFYALLILLIGIVHKFIVS